MPPGDDARLQCAAQEIAKAGLPVNQGGQQTPLMLGPASMATTA